MYVNEILLKLKQSQSLVMLAIPIVVRLIQKDCEFYGSLGSSYILRYFLFKEKEEQVEEVVGKKMRRRNHFTFIIISQYLFLFFPLCVRLTFNV